MKNYKLLTIIAAAALSCVAARADMISGVINFTGGVDMDGSVLSATKVNTWTGVTVESATGDLAGTTGHAVSLATPWTFDSGAVSSFWTVDGFTFDLTKSEIAFQGLLFGQSFLNVSGTGMLSGNGFDATPGTWAFTTQGNGDGEATHHFSFSATSKIPDGGMTMALFGLGLVTVEGLRRKLTK